MCCSPTPRDKWFRLRLPSRVSSGRGFDGKNAHGKLQVQDDSGAPPLGSKAIFWDHRKRMESCENTVLEARPPGNLSVKSGLHKIPALTDPTRFPNQPKLFLKYRNRYCMIHIAGVASRLNARPFIAKLTVFATCPKEIVIERSRNFAPLTQNFRNARMAAGPTVAWQPCNEHASQFRNNFHGRAPNIFASLQVSIAGLSVSTNRCTPHSYVGLKSP